MSVTLPEILPTVAAWAKANLLLLDEPTTGLDPQVRHLIWDKLRRLKAQGTTILLTTHYMAEADELCDRIAIINKGRIIAMDTPSAMKSGMTSESVIDLRTSSEHFTALKTIVSSLERKSTIVFKDHTVNPEISIHTANPSTVIETISPWLNTNLIQTMEMRSQTLEDVYVAIIQNEGANG